MVSHNNFFFFIMEQNLVYFKSYTMDKFYNSLLTGRGNRPLTATRNTIT